MLDVYGVLVYMVNRLATRCSRGDLILKGGTALNEKLKRELPGYFRATRDIDFHVGSIETYREVFGDVEEWLNSGTDKYTFVTVKSRTSSNTSAGFVFEVSDGVNKDRVGIDLNVSPINTITIDTTSTFTIPTYDLYMMLADKMSVVCSPSIYRRIKDIYDIFVILHLRDLNKAILRSSLDSKRPGIVCMENFMILPDNYPQLSHAYEKYRGFPDVDFIDIACLVTSFMWSYMSGREELTRWDHNQLIWVG